MTLMCKAYYPPRPVRGLAASYDRVWQIRSVDFSLGTGFSHLMTLLVLVIILLLFLELLSHLALLIHVLVGEEIWNHTFLALVVTELAGAEMWDAVRAWLVPGLPVHWVLGLLLPWLWVLKSFLSSSFRLSRKPLAIDLNGVFHVTAGGRRYTPWSEVITAVPRHQRWITLDLEEGGTIKFRVTSKAMRDRLVAHIRLLIMHHQSASLLGKLPDPKSQDNV